MSTSAHSQAWDSAECWCCSVYIFGFNHLAPYESRGRAMSKLMQKITAFNQEGLKGQLEYKHTLNIQKHKEEKEEELHSWTLFDRSCRGQKCGVFPFRLNMKRLEWMSSLNHLWCCEQWEKKQFKIHQKKKWRMSICLNVPACLPVWYYSTAALAHILT